MLTYLGMPLFTDKRKIYTNKLNNVGKNNLDNNKIDHEVQLT